MTNSAVRVPFSVIFDVNPNVINIPNINPQEDLMAYNNGDIMAFNDGSLMEYS